MKYLVLVLMLSASMFGADYYVYIDSDDGSDGTWAAMQSESTPAQTISAALVASRTNLSAADTLYVNLDGSASADYDDINLSNSAYAGRNYVFQPWSGKTGTPTINDPASYVLQINSVGNEPSSVTLDSVDCVGNWTGQFAFYIINEATDLTLTGCNVTVTSTCSFCIWADTSQDNTLTISNTTVNTSGNDVLRINGDAGILDFSASTFIYGDSTTDYFIFYGAGVRSVNEIYIDNCTITGHSEPAFSTGTDGTLDVYKIIKITNSNISTTTSGNAVGITQGSGKVQIEGNTISGAERGLFLGDDTGTSETINGAIVRGNTITGGTGHAFATFDGTLYARVTDNKIYDGDYCCVNKGICNTFLRNEIIGPYGFFQSDTYDDEDCYGTVFVNNYVKATGGTAACELHLTGTGGTVGRVKNCIITDNIVDGGSANHAISDDRANIHGNNYIDQNIYVSGTTGLFLLNGNTPSTSDTITTLQAAWAAWTDDGEFDMAYLNDINSRVYSSSPKTGYRINVDGEWVWIGIPQSTKSGQGAIYKSGLYQ